MIWGCKEERREKFLWCSGAVWTVPHEREEEREKRERKEHTRTNMTQKKYSIFLLTNSIYSLSKLRTNIQGFILVLVVLGLLVWLVDYKPNKRLTQMK